MFPANPTKLTGSEGTTALLPGRPPPRRHAQTASPRRARSLELKPRGRAGSTRAPPGTLTPTALRGLKRAPFPGGGDRDTRRTKPVGDHSAAAEPGHRAPGRQGPRGTAGRPRGGGACGAPSRVGPPLPPALRGHLVDPRARAHTPHPPPPPFEQPGDLQNPRLLPRDPCPLPTPRRSHAHPSEPGRGGDDTRDPRGRPPARGLTHSPGTKRALSHPTHAGTAFEAASAVPRPLPVPVHGGGCIGGNPTHRRAAARAALSATAPPRCARARAGGQARGHPPLHAGGRPPQSPSGIVFRRPPFPAPAAACGRRGRTHSALRPPAGRGR